MNFTDRSFLAGYRKASQLPKEKLTTVNYHFGYSILRVINIDIATG